MLLDSPTNLLPSHFANPNLGAEKALPFETVQARVSELISNRIIIGHSLWVDLAVRDY